MKLTEVFYLLGFKPHIQTYGYDIRTFHLPEYGDLKYAQWLHPKEKPKRIQYSAIQEVKQYVANGDVAIDIGAHTGDSTLPLALAVGTQGLVFAIEPNEHVFPILKTNSTLNSRFTNIVPLRFAATIDDGELQMEYSDSGFCNGGRHERISRWRHGHAFTLTVPGKNVDNYIRTHHAELLSRIRFIKIDVEGYDLWVLKSMHRLLAENHPYIKCEIFRLTSSSTRSEIFQLITDLGYSIYRVESDSNYRGEPIASAEDMNKWKHYDIFCVRI